VLKASVPFELVELDRVEVVECVFPRSALEYAAISNKMKSGKIQLVVRKTHVHVQCVPQYSQYGVVL
jgi:hypothetical protein